VTHCKHQPYNAVYGGKVFAVRNIRTHKYYSPADMHRFLVFKGKGKEILLQAWSGPEGSRKLRFPDLMTTAQDGGKVVSLTHRPPLPPGNAPGTHFS